MSHRTIRTIEVRTYVEFDLADIDEQDLIDELTDRKSKVAFSTSNLSESELSNLVDRYHREILRQITQGRNLSASERLFWWQIYGKDV